MPIEDLLLEDKISTEKPLSKYPSFVPPMSKEEFKKVLDDIAESYRRQRDIDEERKRKRSYRILEVPML